MGLNTSSFFDFPSDIDICTIWLVANIQEPEVILTEILLQSYFFLYWRFDSNYIRKQWSGRPTPVVSPIFLIKKILLKFKKFEIFIGCIVWEARWFRRFKFPPGDNNCFSWVRQRGKYTVACVRKRAYIE